MTVFLDKNIYAPAGGYLAEHADVVTDFEHPEKLDAIICRARPITRELIEQCPNLKVIARHGVGVDSVDVECATQRRIAVINAPTSNADSVAELVVALFLMLSRMLYEANVKSREGSFEKKAPANFRGLEMNGKVFGQIGMGNIAARELPGSCTMALAAKCWATTPLSALRTPCMTAWSAVSSGAAGLRYLR